MFSVPEFVAQKLFPLDPVVLDELKAEGFLVFTATTTEEDACTQHIQRGIMYLYVCVCVCVCVCVTGVSSCNLVLQTTITCVRKWAWTSLASAHV